MKRFSIPAAILWAVLGVSAQAQEMVEFIPWDLVNAQNRIKVGEFIDGKGEIPSVLKVVHRGPGGATMTLLEIDDVVFDPQRTKHLVAARVSYEDVEGVGYLELWTHFANGQQFFTRTLASQGRMKSFSGSAKWRDCEITSVIDDSFKGQVPTKLVLNLVLPGKGTVYLGPVTFQQLLPPPAPAMWWSDAAGGLVGGLGGAILGMMGALIGILTSLGRGRKLVFTLLFLLASIGAVGLACGITALVLRQPYGVWYPLLLMGAISLPLAVFLWIPIRKRFAAAELRRVQAMDVK